MFQINRITKIYNPGANQVKALDQISFTVNDGSRLIIMGRSGSGKSTLLRIMGLLDYPTAGEILLDSAKVSKLPEHRRADLRLRHIGYVFQEYALLNELTALQNTYLPGMMLGQTGIDYRQKAVELLDAVGLGQRTNHYPGQLSGGEQQRVAIARALINNPRYLLADEPTANLDTISSKIVMETLSRLNNEMKVTIVFVSHDPDDLRYATDTITLSDGRLTGELR
jgi:putative ABC transport system ATP-binding protein